MALAMMSAQDSFSRTCNAAYVVPPFDVTFSRSTDGGSEDCAAKLAAP